jgi:hypothetical protein
MELNTKRRLEWATQSFVANAESPWSVCWTEVVAIASKFHRKSRGSLLLKRKAKQKT